MKDLKILHPNHCSTAPETLMRPIWWWKTLKKFKKWCSQIVFPPFSRQDGFLATWDPYKMKDLKILHPNHRSTAPETLMRPCLCRFKVPSFMFFFFYYFVCFFTFFHNLHFVPPPRTLAVTWRRKGKCFKYLLPLLLPYNVYLKHFPFLRLVPQMY